MKKGHALSKLMSGTRPGATAVAVAKIVRMGFIAILNRKD
jgi:hypothetical protein